MADKTVQVTIDALGNPVIEAQNFQGQGCASATAGLEDAIKGGNGVSREYKPEWNKSSSQTQQKVKQGW